MDQTYSPQYQPYPPEYHSPKIESVYDTIVPASVAYSSIGPLTEMPLVRHLRSGWEMGKGPGWHRNQERLARHYPPVRRLDVQFEPWETELAWAEVLILTGVPAAAFQHLAFAWGREVGFQWNITQYCCQCRIRCIPERERKDSPPPAVSATVECLSSATMSSTQLDHLGNYRRNKGIFLSALSTSDLMDRAGNGLIATPRNQASTPAHSHEPIHAHASIQLSPIQQHARQQQQRNAGAVRSLVATGGTLHPNGSA
jgi:hypothetical protein